MPEGKSEASGEDASPSSFSSSTAYRLAKVPTHQLSSKKSLIQLNLNQIKHFQNEEPASDAPPSSAEKLKKSIYSDTCYASLKAQQKLRDTEQAFVKTESSDLHLLSSSSKKRASSSESEKYTSNHSHKIPKFSLSLPIHKHLNDRKIPLQEYLASLLSSRGYSNQYYPALEGGYFCKPTEYQKASYGMKLLQAVRTSDIILVDKMLREGVSQNPCNAYGESILHMICRRGDFELLNVFLKHGADVKVCDDFGRTPFHDACWTTKPCFEVVELLLNQDRRLIHIIDCRGASPLSYVKSEHWSQWIDFFERQKDVWWPHRRIETEGEEGPPALCNLAPHSCPQPDRKGISHETAMMIANGIVDLTNKICNYK
jgi:hypothetical protein